MVRAVKRWVRTLRRGTENFGRRYGKAIASGAGKSFHCVTDDPIKTAGALALGGIGVGLLGAKCAYQGARAGITVQQRKRKLKQDGKLSGTPNKVRKVAGGRRAVRKGEPINTPLRGKKRKAADLEESTHGKPHSIGRKDGKANFREKAPLLKEFESRDNSGVNL